MMSHVMTPQALDAELQAVAANHAVIEHCVDIAFRMLREAAEMCPPEDHALEEELHANMFNLKCCLGRIRGK